MDSSLDATPIIDVDTHWTEPPDLWTSRAPASLRDRVLRVERTDEGTDRWVVERDLVMGPVGYCAIRSDGSKAHGTVTLDTFDEIHPAAAEPKARLELMDQQGLSLQVLYPNILGFAGNMIMRIEDADLRGFCVTAYNDAAAEFQASGEGRLYPQALLPFWDVEFAVRELGRCHDELGLTGVVFPNAMDLYGLPTLSDPHWDPLWSNLQERGLPVNFHIGGGRAEMHLWAGMSGAGSVATMSTMVFMGNIECLVNLIFSGLLDRFPGLSFVSVESGFGWLPFMLESAEYQLDENGVTDLELRPLEYFKRQIYCSYWFEKDARYAVEKLGEDNLMFESDFPHPTCVYPDVQGHVRESLGDLEPRVQRKILYETAARLYRLELPS